MKGKTFFISGVAGFVPSHVAQYYLEQGARVIGCDNFITGSFSNVELLSTYPQFEFHEQDVTESLPIMNGKVDYVLSLASPASPIDFGRIPLEIMKVNSVGTWKLLELTKEKGACFLEASTSEVYGDPQVHPQKEDYVGHVNPIGPRSCYDESKRFAEALAMTYHRKHGVDTRIVRIFNTYGPRMRANDGRVIPNFITQALKNEAMTIYGDGTQTRSYCYVSDLVQAIHLVLTQKDSTPFNIGNPEEYTVLETADLIKNILKSSSPLKFFPLSEDDPKKRRPDISKVQKLGFKPQVSFEQGIKLTAEYFKNQ